MSDPDFERFFATEFQRLLERTSIPGTGEASWDRRAAWLLWRMMHPAQLVSLEFEKVGETHALPTDGSVFD